MTDLRLQKGRLGSQVGYRLLWKFFFLNYFCFSVKWGWRSLAETLEEVWKVYRWRRKYDQVV